MTKNKKTGLSENWSIDKSSIEKGQYKILPELNPGVGKYPEEPDGLSQRFTQRKLHEGKILKQIDKELTIERKNSRQPNTGGENDGSV